MQGRARAGRVVVRASALAGALLGGGCDLVFGVSPTRDAGPTPDTDLRRFDADPLAPDAPPTVDNAEQLTFATGVLNLNEISECNVIEAEGGFKAVFTARADGASYRRTYLASSADGLAFSDVVATVADGGARHHQWPHFVSHNAVSSTEPAIVTTVSSNSGDLFLFYNWSTPDVVEWSNQLGGLEPAAVQEGGAIYSLTTSSRMVLVTDQNVAGAPQLEMYCRPGAIWERCNGVDVLSAARADDATDRTPSLTGISDAAPTSLVFSRAIDGGKFDIYEADAPTYAAPANRSSTPEISELGPTRASTYWYFTIEGAAYPRCFRRSAI